MRTLMITASIALLGLSACTASAPQPSSQMAPPSAGSSAAAPQTSNSLPRNDSVNAPRAPATGVVGRTY